MGPRWQQKPPIGTLLNADHPLVGASKLAVFYPFWEAGGQQVTDIAGGIVCKATSTGIAWGSGACTALKMNVNSAGAIGAVPAILQATYPMTIAIGFRMLGTPAGGGMPYFGLFADNVSVHVISLDDHWPFGAYTQVNINLAGAAGNLQSTPNTQLTIGTDYVASGTITNKSFGFYLNGALEVSGTGNYANPTWTATASIFLGDANSFYSAKNMACQLYWAALWYSALSPAQHAAIGQGVHAIWQIFRPIVPWGAFQVSAPGGLAYPGSPPGALVPRYRRIDKPGVNAFYG
jgi:hypothetical protein